MPATAGSIPNASPVDDGEGRQQRAIDTRRSILNHAALLFASSGYDGCSTRDIAAAAKVSHANIRYHFGDKETLWRSVIEFLISEEYEANELLTQLDTSDTPTEIFRQHTRNAISAVAKRPQLQRILHLERLLGNSRFADVETIARDIDEERVGHIEMMQRAGTVNPDVDPAFLNEFIAGGLLQRFVLEPIEDDDERERMVDAFTDLVVRLVQTP
ncbi:MAG: TetR family transcriptional regulator [Pseudomonadota bacterium]